MTLTVRKVVSSAAAMVVSAERSAVALAIRNVKGG